jgi:hypothetical protein
MLYLILLLTIKNIIILSSYARLSYYKYLNKKPSNLELENKKIEKEIINIQKMRGSRYGASKINKSLKA